MEFAIKHRASGQVKEMLLLQRLGFLVLGGDLVSVSSHVLRKWHSNGSYNIYVQNCSDYQWRGCNKPWQVSLGQAGAESLVPGSCR